MTISRHVRKTEWGKTAYRQPKTNLLSHCCQPRTLKTRSPLVSGWSRKGIRTIAYRVGFFALTYSLRTRAPSNYSLKVNRPNRRVRSKDPTTIRPLMRPKFPMKIMVAGGINRYGKTDLYVVPQGETVDGEHYRQHLLPMYTQILNDGQYFPRKNMAVLMQDGTTCHTPRATIAQIQNSGVKVWRDWPGNSPDLNPIEHLWARLQESVLRPPRPKDRQQLIQRVQEEWEAVTQEELWTLCDSFRERILACQQNNGLHTKY